MIDLFVYQDLIGYFLWTLIRISTIISSMPVIGTRLVNNKTKVILSLFLTAAALANQDYTFKVDLMSLPSFMIVFNQFIIGIAFGMILQIIFHSFVLMGQIVSMPMALGFASMNDPGSNVSVPVVGQFYLLLITILFFAFDGHLTIIYSIIDSFKVLPLTESVSNLDFYKIVDLGTWMYVNALKISLPMITSILTVNFTFAVMTKAAPQLNIFTIGFPITLILGLLIVWVNISNVWPHFSGALELGIESFYSFIG